MEINRQKKNKIKDVKYSTIQEEKQNKFETTP